MRLALIILIHKSNSQFLGYPKGQQSSTQQPTHHRLNAMSVSQTLVSHLAANSSSRHVLQRAQLVGLTAIWASMASWLWPQLALWADWMSHRRPTLPSVLGSAFHCSDRGFAGNPGACCHAHHHMLPPAEAADQQADWQAIWQIGALQALQASA